MRQEGICSYSLLYTIRSHTCSTLRKHILPFSFDFIINNSLLVAPLGFEPKPPYTRGYIVTALCAATVLHQLSTDVITVLLAHFYRREVEL